MKDEEAYEVATATGDIWKCPICGKVYRLIHRARHYPNGRKKNLKHDFEEIPDDRHSLPTTPKVKK